MAEGSEGLTGNPLSEREMEVAQLLVTGASNAEIARNLIISPHTVKVHLRNIFEKLQVASRTEASMLLLQHGWIVVPGVELQGSDAQPPAPLPPPEPAPLLDMPAPVRPWQILYLLVALLLSLAILTLPNLIGLAQASADLLTDGRQRSTTPSSIRLEPRWEMRTPLNQPSSRLAMVVLNDDLYVVGGETNSGNPVANVAAYDLATNTWTPRAALPEPRANAAAVSMDGTIYAAGGSVNGSGRGAPPAVSDALLVYDPDVDRWEEAGTLPHPLAGAALVEVAGALYLLGGWDGREMRDEIWRYTPGSAQPAWQVVGHVSKGRAFHGAVGVGGEIYIVGGYDGQRDLNLAEVFTLASGERRQLPPMSAPRGGLALVYDGLAVYALGGGWTQPVMTHERYDPATNAWSNFPSPVQGEWRNLGAAATGGSLYMGGGWSGSYLDSLLEYQSSFRALLPVIITN